MMTMIVMTTPPSIGHLTGVTNKAIENRLSPARDNIPKKESIHTHAARRGGERAHSEEGTAPHVAHLGWRRHDLLWGLLVGTVQVDPQHEDPVFTAVAVVVREAALDARVRLAASEQPHGHRLAAQHTGAGGPYPGLDALLGGREALELGHEDAPRQLQGHEGLAVQGERGGRGKPPFQGRGLLAVGHPQHPHVEGGALRVLRV